MPKAQTSTEYLIVIAVVLVIALLLVGIFGDISFVGGGLQSNTDDIYVQSQLVGIQDWVQDSKSTRFTLLNNGAEKITINSVTLGSTNCTLGQGNVDLGVGQREQVDCYGVQGTDQGESYAYQVRVEYSVVATNAVYALDDPEFILSGEILSGARLHTGLEECVNVSGNHGISTLDCSFDEAGGDAKDDGTAESVTNLSDNVVLDDHTGLYWTSNETGDVTRSEAITYCDDLDQGGFTDWRLPNIVEMTSVQNSGTTGFTSPYASWDADLYWVSTSQSDPYYWAFNVAFDTYGARQNSDPDTASIQAVCVRGDTQAINLVDSPKNFIDPGDGTIIDTDTGLVWTKSVNYTSTFFYNDSIVYCNNLDYAGYQDWKLPNTIEASTLVDYSCEGSNSNCFGRNMNAKFDYFNTDPNDIRNKDYWTSTFYLDGPIIGYILNMTLGGVEVTGGSLKSLPKSVRCVRS